MAELPEEFKKEEKKADADAGDKLDKVLAALDSMSKRMDAIEEEDKKRADAAKADAEEKAKCDAEAAEKAKADAEGKDGDMDKDKPVETAADRKDSEEEAKMKADAEEKERADRAKADADIDKRIADVEAKLPRQMTDADYEKMADAQARADSIYAGYGKRAPRPLDGETELLYRRRLSRDLQKNTKEWKDFDISLLDAKSFAQIETKIYADALEAANHPADLADGDMRAIRSTNPDTGHRVTRFVGNGSFVRQFKQPARIITDMPLAKQSRAG
jgi:membrane protein involved in colicin uptake